METGRRHGPVGAGYAAGRPARSNLCRRISAPAAAPEKPETQRAAPERRLGHDAIAPCVPATHPRRSRSRISLQITGRQGRINRLLRCGVRLWRHLSTLTHRSALLFLLLARLSGGLSLFSRVMIVGLGHGLSTGVAKRGAVPGFPDIALAPAPLLYSINQWTAPALRRDIVIRLLTA